MSKRSVLCLLLAAMCLLGGVARAQALAYSFPMEGLRLAAQADWTVLTPDTLDGEAALLASLGVDAEVLRADYAANHTVFEVYLPGAAQVSLTAVRTEHAAELADAIHMTEAAREAFAASYDHAPYEQVGWAAGLPGVLCYRWTLQAGGVPVSFCALATVAQQRLYTLTASGTASPEALLAACEAVYAALEFLGTPQADTAGAEVGPAVPDAIADDGAATPLALVDFTGVTYADATDIHVRTLPGAEVTIQTSTDTLRNRADADGLVKFQMSTRRETTYEYTLVAQAEGRARSSVKIALQRRLGADALEEAYRRTATQLQNYGYSTLRDRPETLAGQAVSFRGQVTDARDVSGFPCVLVQTNNPGRGVWTNPVWVMLTQAVDLEIGDILTVYGDIRGDRMDYDGEDGTVELPVIVGRSIMK